MSPRPGPKRGLTFTPGNHTYRLDGKPVPGVTGILKVLDKPALMKWAASTVAEFVANQPSLVDLMAEHGGPGPLRAYLKEIPWQRRDDAGARGNVLHDHAEALLHGHEVDVAEQDAPVMESALEFMEDWHIEPLLIETPVASREHWYAGTLDLIAKYRHPVTGIEGTAIWDWKSGKAIYPEYAMQLCAYAFAEFSGLNGDESPLPKTDASFGVHIRSDGYDVHPFEFGPQVYEEFVAIRRVAEIVKRMRGDWKRPGSGYVGPIVPRAGDSE